MPISQALYTGVTGLSVNSDGMSVIANNIANSNAKGFKRDRAEFEDLLSADLGSGAGGAQIGRGARLRDVKTVHSQGGLAVTNNLTDLAIQGSGFFILNNPKTEVQESAGKLYTRVGSFNFDKEGYLADALGGRVQGYLADGSGTVSTRLTDIRIRTSSIPPAQTKKLLFNINLDAREKVMEGDFDIANAEKTSNFNNTVSVFDSQGRAHQVTTYFKRIEDTEGISWKWFATLDPKEVTDPDGQVVKQFASGQIKFDQLGNLVNEETIESNVNFADGALPEQVIEFDFGQNAGIEEGKGVNASTSIAAKSNTVFHYQDGYESGNLKALSIELDGTITGLFTNGLQRRLGVIGLASFENQDGLQKAGRNQWFASYKSGPPKIGTPQSGTRGSVYASTLEESNVDLAEEFVNMIMTQRAFQANSRSVTTTDGLMEEVINLKR